MNIINNFLRIIITENLIYQGKYRVTDTIAGI